MASASVVGQQRQQHTLSPEPALLFGVKKVQLPWKSSSEKMVFGRSSVSSALKKSPTTAVIEGGVTPGDGCRTPDRRWHVSGADCVLGTSERGSVKRPGAMEVTASKGAHRRATPQNVTSNGCAHAEIGGVLHGGSLPLLERLHQGRTGVVRLARTEPHRREAWAIFPPGVDPRVRMERGEGHRFEAKAVKQDWCDACSCQINAQVLKCQNCSYTCHLKCESEVQLDCNQRDRKHERTSPPRIPCSTPPQPTVEAKEEEEGGTKELSEEEVRQRIEEYNSQVSENGMKLASDGSYTGFIKVHLRLSRPVTVDGPALDDQTSNHNPRISQDVVDDPPCAPTEKRTSFYLPCDCVKQLHISSLTTTREVIQGLLKKFMVLDNPRKFALYRQTHRDGQDLFQKLPLYERPLQLRLIEGPDTETLSFLLKENETGEVEWHAFSVPELQNFLVILEKEEVERVRAVEQKYSVYRKKLQLLLQRHDP